MRRFKFAMAAGLLASLPLSAANAGWYVGADGGVSFIQGTDAGSSTNETDYDLGMVALGQVGYKIGAFGFEGELGWRGADIDKIGSFNNTSGDINVYSVMGNVVVDVANFNGLRPFVGLGVGTAYVDSEGSVGNTRQYEGNDWTFAYQMFAGAAYDVSDNWSLKGQYRYFDTTEFNTNTRSGGKYDPDFKTHEVLVGFTYSFGAPAPTPAPVAPTPAPAAPAPAPAAAPPSNYMVFFDWNQSTITPVARDIIVKAASAAKAGSKARIDLTGHTDRSGTDAYNLKLSLARAEAVKAELASLGIPAEIVNVDAKGESNPMVKTDDGIREPQNRRVEIIIP